MKLKLISAFAVGAFAGITAGCQTYDFEPVEPLAIAQTTQTARVVAKNLKPNLMFLIDKSGSMAFPTNTANANCPAGCGPDGVGGSTCPANCPTRITELRTAMNTFLTANGNLARMGMAIYPTATPDAQGATNACGATVNGDIKVQLSSSKDIDAELTKTASDVNNEIQQLKVNGGTPTADSLRFLGNYMPLQDPERDDFVLLLTDGLPNCNTTNVNDCNNAAACKCTTSACTPTNGLCKAGCLDKDNSANAAGELALKKIRTIVIGFGADTATGDGPDSLNAMADQGGFARKCVNGTDAECGMNNTCNAATGICNKRFYQAANTNDLATALKEIIDIISGTDLCKYTLDAVPTDPKFLAVIIDGQNVTSGSPDTWDYAAGVVSFKGALCTKVKSATTAAPVLVEFRIIESL